MRRSAFRFVLALVALSGAVTGLATAGTASAGEVDIRSVDWTASPNRLLMVEARGCIYCETWKREIGPGYPESAEGKAAPLLVTDINGPWPDGVALERRPVITPTFILLQGGKEMGRIEGYPGDNFFYPLIDEMLAKAGLSPDDRKEDG